MVGLNEVDGVFVGEITGNVLGAGVGGRLGEDEEVVMIVGQFSRAELQTLSSGVNRVVSLAPFLPAVTLMVEISASLVGLYRW